jgi:sulfofructose kinase
MHFPFNFADDKRFDVVGFGTNAVDHLITVERYPAFDSKVEIVGREIMPGGEVASTLVGLARLGIATCYVGRFGDDAEGALGLQSLADEGVDLSAAEVIPGATTQLAYIVIDQATGERTVMWSRDSRLGYDPDEAPLELARSCRVLHLTPHDTAASTRMAEAARESGGIVSLDVDRWFPGTEHLMQNTDICVSSAPLLAEITGQEDPRTALAEFSERFGCAICGVTLGDAGSMLICNGEIVESPAFAVPGGAVDTTGAGDAFRSGLLFGVLNGRTLAETSRIGNAVAALKCRAPGARTGLPGLAELDHFIGLTRL